MSTETQSAAAVKHVIDIEGTLHPWPSDTITVPEIRRLGHLPENLPVLEVNLQTGTQRQLAEDEVVQVRPGMGYSKKVSFRRG